MESALQVKYSTKVVAGSEINGQIFQKAAAAEKKIEAF